MTGTVIVSARRTPIGSLNGALSSLSGHELGAAAIRAALSVEGVRPEDVGETIFGQVLIGGQGMNPARQAARKAGLSDLSPAAIVNQVCGSGLRAVAIAHQQILSDPASIVVAGGQESMSNGAHAATLRQGMKLGDVVLKDTVFSDGLSDAFYGYPMGTTAENVAREHDISRASQDQFALDSQRKASAASTSGRFAEELVPMTVQARKGTIEVSSDEYIRHDASLEAIARLKPAFMDGGTVTAANASGINDGAAALLLMSTGEAARRNIEPLARIVGWAQAGVDPQVMGLGPIPASRRLLDRVGWQASEVDLWEVNEAFAAQSIAVVRELGIDPDRVNVNGGAIALGHPIGASGARVLVTLVHELRRRGGRRGVATLCIGGGMGIALAVSRD